MPEVLILPTERDDVVLRQLATPADDIAYFNAAQEDPDHVDNYGNRVASVYTSIELVRDRRLSAGEDIRMGIWAEEDFKGAISARFKEGSPDTEIGYWLKKSATGNGYATLALKAITDHIVNTVPRIYAEVNVENIASINVLERAGYKPKMEVDRFWGRAIVFEPSL